MPALNKGTVIEDSAAILLARVRNTAGDPIASGDIATITLKSFKVVNAATATLIVPEGEVAETYAGTALDPADVVLSGLQTGYLAEQAGIDDDGYNIRIDLHGSYWPSDGKYRVELKFIPNGGDPFYLLWELKAENIFSE